MKHNVSSLVDLETFARYYHVDISGILVHLSLNPDEESCARAPATPTCNASDLALYKLGMLCIQLLGKLQVRCIKNINHGNTLLTLC